MITRLKFSFNRASACNLAAHQFLAPEDFDSLVKAFPGFKVPEVARWEACLAADDPLVGEIFTQLERCGRLPYSKTVPWYSRTGDARLFLVKKEHEFTIEEKEFAPFLEIVGEIEMGEHKHLHHDFPLLVRIKAKIPPIGHAEGAKGLICTQTCKEAMERDGFVGFTFTPVVVEGKRQPPEPLWEMWSDRMMPPLCCALVDDDGKPVTPGDYSNGCHAAECEYPPIYRYDTAALAPMAGVDAAVTHEDFHEKTKLCEMRRLMVSQRFRQWTLKNKIKLDYTPVFVNAAPAG